MRPAAGCSPVSCSPGDRQRRRPAGVALEPRAEIVLGASAACFLSCLGLRTSLLPFRLPIAFVLFACASGQPPRQAAVDVARKTDVGEGFPDLAGQPARPGLPARLGPLPEQETVCPMRVHGHDHGQPAIEVKHPLRAPMPFASKGRSRLASIEPARRKAHIGSMIAHGCLKKHPVVPASPLTHS